MNYEDETYVLGGLFLTTTMQSIWLHFCRAPQVPQVKLQSLLFQHGRGIRLTDSFHLPDVLKSQNKNQ